jgi:hypothetical protein
VELEKLGAPVAEESVLASVTASPALPKNEKFSPQENSHLKSVLLRQT